MAGVTTHVFTAMLLVLHYFRESIKKRNYRRVYGIAGIDKARTPPLEADTSTPTTESDLYTPTSTVQVTWSSDQRKPREDPTEFPAPERSS